MFAFKVSGHTVLVNCEVWHVKVVYDELFNKHDSFICPCHAYNVFKEQLEINIIGRPCVHSISCILCYAVYAILSGQSCSKHHLHIEGVSQGVVKSSNSQKSSVLQIKNAEKSRRSFSKSSSPFFSIFNFLCKN